jgi:hypothetical protein
VNAHIKGAASNTKLNLASNEGAKRFASIVPSGKFSLVAIQGFLLNYIDNPKEAYKKVGEWVENERKQKRS